MPSVLPAVLYAVWCAREQGKKKKKKKVGNKVTADMKESAIMVDTTGAYYRRHIAVAILDIAVDLFIWEKTIALLSATPSHALWHAMPHHVVRCSKRSSNQSLYGLRCVRPDLITV